MSGRYVECLYIVTSGARLDKIPSRVIGDVVTFVTMRLSLLAKLKPFLTFRRAAWMPGMAAIQGTLDSGWSARAKVEHYLLTSDQKALHLGCGEKHFQDWLNIDIGGKADICWDLNYPLNFLGERKWDYCFSEHVLEHFPRPVSTRLMAEIFRALKPGGIVRLALPDLDVIVHDYIRGFDRTQFGALNEEFRKQYGDVYYTKGEFLDICMRGWGHTYLYNFEDIEILLKRVGFGSVIRQNHRVSNASIFSGIETRSIQESNLVVEAIKNST